jgi:hypothetical protein
MLKTVLSYWCVLNNKLQTHIQAFTNSVCYTATAHKYCIMTKFFNSFHANLDQTKGK